MPVCRVRVFFLSLILVAVAPLALADNETTSLEPVVVTAEKMAEPLVVVSDPKAPKQPIPAHDGADYLKTVPGFSVIRKGGSDGDPVFRGMAGSRLNILQNGELVLGGCGNRMDPPTAYIFPESFDRVIILKGPQSVLYGPGNSAGTVRFERETKPFSQLGYRFDGSLTVGSFGRNDQVADLRAGAALGYAQFNATRSHSGDFQDGSGRRIHSRYTRWMGAAAFGWTPDEQTKLELSAIKSDGEAAYADRTMDGSQFKRENFGLRFERVKLSPLVEKIAAQIYDNYVDHVMDNYSLRSPPPKGMAMVSNPDRKTTGGRFAVDLRPADRFMLTLGLDQQINRHSIRSASSMRTLVPDYRSKERLADAHFRNTGFFAEGNWHMNENARWIGGARLDLWNAEDQRTTMTSVTGGKNRNENLKSGFLRYEYDVMDNATLYAGLGHSARAPDYWELLGGGKQSIQNNSAFETNLEKTTQLDVGWLYHHEKLELSVSGFYSQIKDFILIDRTIKPAISVVRNVDARTLGGEASVLWRFSPAWSSDLSLAYVRGNNRTDHTPLAQMPPLEARVGLNWQQKGWAVGSLLRLVSKQNRVDVGKGNIVGQDIAKSQGFAVFSLNAAYRIDKRFQIVAGVDNLFNRQYAEHISRAGSDIAGFEQSIRVNEPGRNFWIRARLSFD